MCNDEDVYIVGNDNKHMFFLFLSFSVTITGKKRLLDGVRGRRMMMMMMMMMRRRRRRMGPVKISWRKNMVF